MMMKKILALFAFLILTFSSRAQNSNLAVQRLGTGKRAIILLPGYASSADVWKETVEHLSGKYTCFVFSMPGFAGVPGDSTPSIKNWVAGIADYVNKNKMDKPAIIGHSLGGLMALWLAADYPDLFSRIIVVDAVPAYAALNNPSFHPVESPDCSGYIKYFSAMNENDFYRFTKANMKSMVTDTVRAEQITKWSQLSDRKTLATIFCEFLNTDIRDKISTIHIPVLMLMEPAFRSNPNVKDQYKNLKGYQMLFSGRGLHFIMYDDPAWFAEQVDQFLK